MGNSHDSSVTQAGYISVGAAIIASFVAGLVVAFVDSGEATAEREWAQIVADEASKFAAQQIDEDEFTDFALVQIDQSRAYRTVIDLVRDRALEAQTELQIVSVRIGDQAVYVALSVGDKSQVVESAAFVEFELPTGDS